MTSQLGWTILSGTERGRCVSFLRLNISDKNSEFGFSDAFLGQVGFKTARRASEAYETEPWRPLPWQIVSKSNSGIELSNTCAAKASLSRKCPAEEYLRILFLSKKLSFFNIHVIFLASLDLEWTNPRILFHMMILFRLWFISWTKTGRLVAWEFWGGMCKVSSGIDTAGCKCRFVCRNLLGKCWELVAALLINKSTLGSKLGPSQLSGRAIWVGQAWILIWTKKPILPWAWARPGSNDLPTSSGLPLALVFSFVFVFLTN